MEQNIRRMYINDSTVKVNKLKTMEKFQIAKYRQMMEVLLLPSKIAKKKKKRDPLNSDNSLTEVKERTMQKDSF